MNNSLYSGRTALVTGASSGLGSDFARQLARQGANLIITARRAAALEALAREIIAETPGINVDVIVLDLGQSDSVERLAAEIATRGLVVDILINNAGYGSYGPFDQIPWEKENTMLQLDIVTLVRTTKVFAEGMKKRGWGRILQVASIAAFQATPLYASYGAGKAFVLNYGIAVNRELRGTGVTCTVLSPGVTATEFLKVADQRPTSFQRSTMMTSPAVAKIGLAALAKGRKSVVPGFGNTVAAVMTRFIGRGVAAAVAEAAMR
ncbi:MAG: hypothetical protein A2087_10905 [Spirochaetes bacterium GWD1_61_31]|nr:MAG: hypothetical protein A2Y37_06930 [Spirochaetes bacterium GWB1_60_80]OHD30808.1 MAG: hypothetical protein A2004_04455 [Spirochaetes bacterium GWC1_61_12]OHD36401.1 MAG: hypothetical protein A2087_10905 [Spirochaetes bacterium GWD1_61_31]OHD46308.1 MAG: hypothetical protein A2Y35_07205 [Spirochaetes bacterium GWE1_60_18]OHD60915.1 MAG: hypothetical protein A2Y32_11950 [Spirochaetes bacterium GWF1_60_12]HAP42827.1 oxidoreductase [Spirochaetaceae bacterium]